MAFCEQCGHALNGTAFCEGCGAPAVAVDAAGSGAAETRTVAQASGDTAGPRTRAPQRAATATLDAPDDAPPVRPTPAAIPAGPRFADPPTDGPRLAASRRRWRRIVGVVIAMCAVVGAVVAALVATGTIGAKDAERPTAAKPKPPASALPQLPTADLADDTITDAAYLPMPRLLHSVTLVAGQDDAPQGPLHWAVYAIPGTDAGSVCREIEMKWLPVLDRTMGRDDPRLEDLGSTYTQTGQGCAYSYTELSPPAANSLGPLSYDIAVRAFAAKDPATHDAAARAGALGAITPKAAPLYEGPYVEVSRVLSRNPIDVEYLDGSRGDDNNEIVGAVDDGVSSRELAHRIEDLIAYSRLGRAASQAGDFDAAERNRRQTLRRAKQLGRNLADDDPLWDSVAWLQESARASLAAVRAYQSCGGVACAATENERATNAKQRFVEAFNPLARRYLHRSYVATDL